jgi:vitamin B12 transporter
MIISIPAGSLRRPAAACATTFLLCAAQAAEEPHPLKPVIVTASAVPITLGQEVAATSVLTRRDLERAGVRDAVSALELLGTASVEQQGGPGTAAVVRLRGADSRDTLVLVDGIPLTDVTSGQASLSQIPVEWIERIEVVRGNLAALHGGGATGGVIQIFTRRGASGFGGQGSVGAGSRGARSAQASIAGGSDALRARLTLGSERTDGFSAADPVAVPTANPDADGNRRSHVALALDGRLAAGHELALDLRENRGRVEYDSVFASSSPTDTHTARIEQRALALRGRHDVAAGWALGWRLGGADEKRSDTEVTAFGPFTFGNTLHNRVAALSLDGALGGGWALQLGAERLQQSTDNLTYTRQDRRTDSARAGATYTAAWGSLQANLRHDRTSDFGASTNGLLGGTLKLGGGLQAIASASTSHTPPTLDFLYFDCAPFGFVCNNPNLRPERARNVDLGLQWESDDVLLRATWFAARYRDKIASDAFFVPQNVARARNEGLELAARARWGAWRVAGEATLQDPVDAATGQRLLRRPQRQGVLRAEHDAGRWSAGAALRHVGDRDDSGGVTLPSYSVVDVAARWVLDAQWSLQARVENLFDRRYAPTAGYNGKPRGAFVALNWQSAP